MNVNGVSGYSNVDYGTIASGRRVNTAADDASGLTQIQKLDSENGGLKAGAENAQTGISLTKVADGALSGISDYLQSIKEASVKALNGVLTDSDKQSIQDEIDGYMKGISDIAGNTTFNTKNILNNNEELNIATNPDGSGSSVSTANATLQALGIEGYNVTGDFMGLALFSFRGNRRNKTFLALLFFIFLLTVAAADMVYFHTLLNKNRRSAAPGAEEKKGQE